VAPRPNRARRREAVDPPGGPDPPPGCTGAAVPHHATAGTSHPTTCLVLRVPAHDTSVRVARHALRSLGGMVEESLITRGELVVSELVTNAIQHGSSDDDEVVLRLAVEGDEIIGAVTDHGPSFEPPTGPPELTRP